MIYKGPSNGEGIIIYKDGLHIGDDDQLAHVSGWTTNNSGRLMIGRLFELSADPETAKHAEAVVDELLIWNRQLSADEIMEVKKMQWMIIIYEKNWRPKFLGFDFKCDIADWVNLYLNHVALM